MDSLAAGRMCAECPALLIAIEEQRVSRTGVAFCGSHPSLKDAKDGTPFGHCDDGTFVRATLYRMSDYLTELFLLLCLTTSNKTGVVRKLGLGLSVAMRPCHEDDAATSVIR